MLFKMKAKTQNKIEEKNNQFLKKREKLNENNILFCKK